MAAYHFTLHAYRTWNADRPQGYVVRGRGIQPQNFETARAYDARATQPRVLFTPRHQRVIVWAVWDACRRRHWKLHQVATDDTHVHALVSWRMFLPWQQVRAKLKNLISWALTKEFKAPGKSWLVREGSRKRVTNRRHFDYLMEKYLPDHRGLKWRDGDPPPLPPAWEQLHGRGTRHRDRCE